MHREMHRSTSRRVDTGLASISCGLISSITESRLAGPGLSILVRAMCVRVRDRKKKKGKKTRDPVHHMRAPSEMLRRSGAMEIAKLSDGRILRRWRWLTSDTGFDRSLCRVWLAQQAINNSSLFLQIRISLCPAFFSQNYSDCVVKNLAFRSFIKHVNLSFPC